MVPDDTNDPRRRRPPREDGPWARPARIGAPAATLVLLASLSALGAVPAGAAAPTVVVKQAHTKVGTVLVTAKGLTLYHFTPDGTTKVTCTGGCTAVWPPLLAPGGKKATGLKGLGTIHGANGVQVTYHGEPLYLFSGDKAAGQVNGQGIANQWFAVQPSAAKVTASGATTTTKAGGYGY